MTEKRTDAAAEVNPLTPEQQALLEELQRLYASGCEEVPDELIDRIRRLLRWSWDDPLSIERSVHFMAHDPYYQRELRAVNEDFACTDADGLRDL
jgi:hypothetical protein